MLWHKSHVSCQPRAPTGRAQLHPSVAGIPHLPPFHPALGAEGASGLGCAHHRPCCIRSPARLPGCHVTHREPPAFVVLIHKYLGTQLIRDKLF